MSDRQPDEIEMATKVGEWDRMLTEDGTPRERGFHVFFTDWDKRSRQIAGQEISRRHPDKDVIVGGPGTNYIGPDGDDDDGHE